MKSDLTNEYAYNQELIYAKYYQKNSFFSKVCTIIFVLLWIMIFLPEILGFGINKKTEYVLLWSAGTITFLGAISTLIFARCPKCKKVQPAGYGGAELAYPIQRASHLLGNAAITAERICLSSSWKKIN